MKLSLCLLFIFSCLSTYAVEIKLIDEIKGKIEEIKSLEIVQTATLVADKLEEYPVMKTPKEDNADFEIKMDVCVECADILKLTKAVNKIIGKYSVHSPQSYLALEQGNLEALTVITEAVHKDNSVSGCVTYRNEEVTNEFMNFDKKDMTLQFSQALTEDFQSAIFERGQKNKTIWLRGKDNDYNRIIKVDIYPNGTSVVSYYTLNKAPAKRVQTYKEPRANEQKLPDLGKTMQSNDSKLTDILSGTLEYRQDINLVDHENVSIKAEVGPSVTYKYFIPKEVRIMDLSSRVSIQGAELKGKVEITNEDQTASLDFKDKNTGLKGSANVNSIGEYTVGTGAEVTVAEKFDIDTFATYTSSGKLSVDTKFSYDGNNLVNTNFTRTQENERVYTISKDYKPNDSGTLSLKFQSKQTGTATSSDNSFWLSYTQKF